MCSAPVYHVSEPQQRPGSTVVAIRWWMVKGEIFLSLLILISIRAVLRAVLNALAMCCRKLAHWSMMVTSDLMHLLGLNSEW